MKKMFAVVLFASVALAACGSKKEATTPKTIEKPADATGGAAYGGAAYGGSKGTANPCSSH